MRKIYVFYADVFLAQNFLMDAIALMAAKIFLKKSGRKKYLLLASGLGSLLGLSALLLVKNYLLYCLFTHFFLNPAMIGAAFGKMGKRDFLKTWLVTYIVVILCGGAMEWIGKNGIAALALVFIVLGAAVFLLEENRNLGIHLFEARLQKGGRSMCLTAYWDSGNQLRDIYTGRPVCILNYEKFAELFGTETMVRYVPFASLGEQQGLLAVADADALYIRQKDGTICVRNAAIGAASKGLLEKKEYDLILHASLCKQ